MRRRRDRTHSLVAVDAARRRRYGTLADALKHDEFRVKDIAGNDGAIVYELEHEVRTLNHPGFVAKRRIHQEL